MLRYVGRRVLSTVPVLVVVGLVSFALVHLAPGNVAQAVLGEQATQQEVADYQHFLGLDKPIYVQFLDWGGHVLHGNFGYSLVYHSSVTSVVLGHVVPTAWLSVLSTGISILFAVPLALLVVRFRDSILDRLAVVGGLAAVSIPTFWLSLVAVIVFAVQLRWLPVSGYVGLSDGVWPWASHLILPVVVLTVLQGALILRMLRDSLIECMGADYIRTARSKGALARDLLIGHAVPNALIPTITVIGLSFATLLSGAVVVEVVFNIPGLGELVVQAIGHRDYPVVEGVTLFVAAMYVMINLFTDLVYVAFDPRIKYS